ncbi:unnamed protein product [Gadus morhua 'NCC']
MFNYLALNILIPTVTIAPTVARRQCRSAALRTETRSNRTPLQARRLATGALIDVPGVQCCVITDASVGAPWSSVHKGAIQVEGGQVSRYPLVVPWPATVCPPDGRTPGARRHGQTIAEGPKRSCEGQDGEAKPCSH